MLNLLSFKLICLLLLGTALSGADDDIHKLIKRDEGSAVVNAIRANSKLLNLKNNKGNTPLHLAVAMGRLKIMRNLLALGADLEIRNDQGMSPLGVAVYYGNSTAVKLLIQRGANPGEKFWKYDNHFLPEMIVLRGNVEMAEYFQQIGVDFLAYEKVGGSLISLAAFDRRVAMLEFLISIGAKIDGSQNGISPLHLAIDATQGIYLEEKTADFVQVMVDGGANVNALDDKGWSPLQRAASNGQFEVVKILYKAGAANVSRPRCRKTPLALAKENDHQKTFEYIQRMEKLKKRN